jgi:lactoylglutathione lyase
MARGIRRRGLQVRAPDPRRTARIHRGIDQIGEIIGRSPLRADVSNRMSDMVPFMGFDHVGVSVRDLDAMTRWYSDVLDLSPDFLIDVPQVRLRGVMLRSAEGFRVELLERQGSVPGSPGTSPADALMTQGLGHWSLHVLDLEAVFERFVRAGAGVIAPIGPSPQPGAKFAYLSDPEGNLIELLQRPP